MDPVFALKILLEKYKEKQKDLHMIFFDHEKAYNSSQKFDMVGHEKEIDPRGVHEGDTGYVQRKTNVQTIMWKDSSLLFIIIMD